MIRSARRSRATPSRASARPMARSGRATCAPSPPRCSASPVWSSTQYDASPRNCSRGIATANISWRSSTSPAAALVVGMQCVGSDAVSGVTAYPALGFVSYLLVRAGATVMFSVNTEVRDGIAQLTARAADASVARAIIAELGWYDRYLERGEVDRSANTTPGNKKGGLSNIVEKAMGSIIKSGTAPIAGVVRLGERAAR